MLLIDVLFEHLAWAKGHNTTGSDSDFLPGSRISPFPRAFAADHKISEPGDLHRLSLLQHRLQEIEDEFYDIRCLFFRHANFFKNFVGNIGLSHPSALLTSRLMLFFWRRFQFCPPMLDFPITYARSSAVSRKFL